jgi:hypothetical protein
MHLLKEDKLRVMPSSIPNAGRGLFTVETIRPNDVVGEYAGPIVQNWNMPQHDDDDYMFTTTGNKVNPRVTITARNPLDSTVTRFINDGTRQRRNNVKFTNSRIIPCHRNNFAAIQMRALKRVRGTPDEPKELFAAYGEGYWNDEQAKKEKKKGVAPKRKQAKRR